jgi:hypothetical protein
MIVRTNRAHLRGAPERGPFSTGALTDHGFRLFECSVPFSGAHQDCLIFVRPADPAS